MTSKEIKKMVRTRQYVAIWRYGYTTWGYDDSGCSWEGFYVSQDFDGKADAIAGQNARFKADGRAKKYPGIKCTDVSLDSIKCTLVDLYSGEAQEIVPDDHTDIYSKWHQKND